MRWRTSAGWAERGPKKDVERSVRSVGKLESRIAGGGMFVGGWAFGGSGGGVEAFGMLKGRGEDKAGGGEMVLVEVLKSSHGSSSSTVSFGSAEGDGRLSTPVLEKLKAAVFGRSEVFMVVWVPILLAGISEALLEVLL